MGESVRYYVRLSTFILYTTSRGLIVSGVAARDLVTRLVVAWGFRLRVHESVDAIDFYWYQFQAFGQVSTGGFSLFSFVPNAVWNR
ncbi:MAG: hypothetical protein O7C75_07735 [Verrucomicrobia bacterium]|nr:hypothetical protein [Verrucomicrobiota bacterium]